MRMNSACTTQLPVGVELVSVRSYQDVRGRLSPLERHSSLPFTPVRTFVIRDVPPGQTRAGHALTCHEFLWVLEGSCAATVYDGRIRLTIRLHAGQQALVVSPGVWIGLSHFERGTVLLALASKPYSETKRFPEPQPALIATCTQRT
jgi:hypothetical protein